MSSTNENGREEKERGKKKKYEIILDQKSTFITCTKYFVSCLSISLRGIELRMNDEEEEKNKSTFCRIIQLFPILASH
jgi:hypothetical protein